MLQDLDYAIFAIYFLIISVYGYIIYKKNKTREASARDYFLAEGSLTWWAIGASLIASNISAEQFIGMSGSGFKMGLAISSYEWMSAITLIIIAIFFLPVYIKNGISTMPQFLSRRYNDTVASVMAVFWLFVYVFVNLTSIIYLGALAVSAISGLPFEWCIAGLTLFAIFITLGGMKVIGYTDVIQVLVLVIGGLMTTYIALSLINTHFGGTGGILGGLGLLREKAPDHFHMIFSPDNPNYKDLPGFSVLLGGMWIANLYYWGCNQYITQRALGADLKTARSGLLFAGFLKLLMPLIVVIPGIAAWVLYKEGIFTDEMTDATGNIKPDRAYPTLLSLLPVGFKGMAFAALTAAIVASLAGKANSISTIFTMDIYKKFLRKDASVKQQITTGKIVIVVALIIGAVLSPALKSFEQGFQFIQEFTGFVSPGALAIFLLGFFWRRTTSAAALAGAVLTFPASMLLHYYASDIPFLDRMGIVFLGIMAIMIIMSLVSPRAENKALIPATTAEFRVTGGFAIGSICVTGILAVLYLIFW